MKNVTMNALASGTLGAALGLGLPTEAAAQTFHGSYVIRTEVDNRCLDANMSDPPRTDGGRVQMWECNGLPAQRWDLLREPAGGGRFVYRLVNRYSGTCLDRPYIGDGSPVHLWRCHGGVQQLWFQLPATNVASTVTLNPADDARFALDYHLGTVGNGGMAQIKRAYVNPAPPQQQWWLDYQN